MSAKQEAASPDAAAAKSGSKKKLVLLAVPLLLIAVAAGLWFSGILPKMLGMGAKAATEQTDKSATAKPAETVFLDLPEMVANLNVGARRSQYVKLKAKLELARPEDVAIVQAAMPRIVDLFQTYLREMRPEELRGSAGTYRLREELISRASTAAPPARVLDLLFTEMLVQ
jgi:flagellar FliL protein